MDLQDNSCYCPLVCLGGVTVTLHILEGTGLIRLKRSRVIIRDRKKLEQLAGDSYGVPEAEHRHLIEPLGRRYRGG